MTAFLGCGGGGGSKPPALRWGWGCGAYVEGDSSPAAQNDSKIVLRFAFRLPRPFGARNDIESGCAIDEGDPSAAPQDDSKFRFAFCVYRFAFCVLHFAFCILHSAFCILLSAFFTLLLTYLLWCGKLLAIK